MDLQQTIRKFALQNAFQYGKAQPGGVVGKVVAEFPDAKSDMRATMQQIAAIVEEVNALPKEEVEKQLASFEFKKKEEGPKIWELPGAEKGKVVTRFLPEPNGYPHLGHAKAAFLSWEFARMWEGECKLRFDDTNPEAEKLEFVQAIKDDLKWLGLKFKEETYTSDRMPVLMQFAKKLIILGHAYMCVCPAEEMNKNRYDKKPCACRNRVGGENLALWGKMAAGATQKGEMVLRLRADMESDNTVMRDPTLFRSIHTPHYRQGEKFKAWPTYDFEVSIADSLEDVTHALRSKEYELRDELYYAILKSVNLRKPFVYDFARLKIKGTALSKRLIKPLIESGTVKGWDDPRLATLRGLRRRGFLPEAIKEFVIGLGLSKQESSPSLDQLIQINRKMLDPVAEHYFFVENPVQIKLSNITKAATVKLEKKGNSKSSRSIKVKDAVFVPQSDVAELKTGDVLRLKELFNVKISSVEANGSLQATMEGNDPVPGAKVVQWVSALEGESVPCTVVQVGDLLDENEQFNKDSWSERTGVCEKACGKLKEGQMVQLERTGFARTDAVAPESITFILNA